MRNGLVLISVFCFSWLGFSQEIRTILSEKSAQVGDPIQLTYEVELEKQILVKAEKFQTAIRAFRSNTEQPQPDTIEVLTIGDSKDTVVKLQGKFYWQRTLRIVVMDTGYLVFPPRTFDWNATEKTTQPALLRVDLVPEQKDLDLYDIQEHFTELPPLPFDWSEWIQNYGWIVLLIGLIVMVGFGIFWYIKTKPEPVAPPISPEEMAINEWNALMAKRLWMEQNPKAHFVELTEILKQYLSRVHGEHYLEKTSTEIVLKLKQAGISEQDARKWSFLLNVSDMVKFAKSDVDGNTVESLNEQAKSLILRHRQA